MATSDVDAALRPLVAQLVAERQRKIAARRAEAERRNNAIASQLATQVTANAERLLRAALAGKAEARSARCTTREQFAAGNLSIADLNATPIGASRTVTTPSGRQHVWTVIEHAVTR
ncbi:MAG: hypothetical protein AB1689_12455 [Thermodesulfobacteriota bacterium]